MIVAIETDIKVAYFSIFLAFPNVFLPFSAAINFEQVTNMPVVQVVWQTKYTGITSWNRPIPSVPMILAK